jgi:hypothetical protein
MAVRKISPIGKHRSDHASYSCQRKPWLVELTAYSPGTSPTRGGPRDAVSRLTSQRSISRCFRAKAIQQDQDTPVGLEVTPSASENDEQGDVT